MSVYLKIFDIDSASPVDLKSVMILDLPDNTISVRELITKRVCAEVEKYNAGEKFEGLVKPNDMEKRLNQESKSRRLSAQRQIDVALKGFETNGFFLLVDDEQVTDLDAMIAINNETSIAFFRLIPLVGG